ncbi:MAG: sulfotransferase domain-containing protein, partial [Myxococcota bacterium]|nr:sulfotransferase domain-containing protein [Myxococcota bacterium]
MPLHTIPRNWTRKARTFANADVFLVSIPKSGRTWLRFQIRHYLCSLAGLPFSIKPCADEPQHLPRLACSHDLWEHLSAPRFRDRLRGKYIIPREQRRTRKILLAVRDLRDVMVSLHLQLTRREFRSGVSYDGDLSAMIRDRRLGARRAVDILNYWFDEWHHTDRFHIWNYENARKDPHGCLREVLHFLGFENIDEELLARSIEFGDFESMQAMERDHRFDLRLMRPGDPRDPESFKVRRGRVGGYVDYLSDEDARLIERAS